MPIIKKSLIKNLNKLTGYDFDDRYVCDNKGNVYLVKEKDGDSLDCKEMSPFETRDGYIEYVLTKSDGKKQHIQAHRIVAGLYLNKVRGKDFVNHKDGKRDNNFYKNLQWSTVSENIQHSFDKLNKKVWNKK